MAHPQPAAHFLPRTHIGRIQADGVSVFIAKRVRRIIQSFFSSTDFPLLRFNIVS